jgi:hypothetical protein
MLSNAFQGFIDDHSGGGDDNLDENGEIIKYASQPSDDKFDRYGNKFDKSRIPEGSEANKLKYNVLLMYRTVYNKKFYVSEEDNNLINSIDSNLKEYFEDSISELYFFQNTGQTLEKYFIVYDWGACVQKIAIEKAMVMMKQKKEKYEKDIQTMANRPGSTYFTEMSKKWNDKKLDDGRLNDRDFNDGNKIELLDTLKARQEAVTKNTSLASDDKYTYGLTVRLDKNSKQCVKSKDLWLPDGEWQIYKDEIKRYSKTFSEYANEINAVDAERNCSSMNKLKSSFTSAASSMNPFTRFRSSSPSPAAGGRRTKKRSSRRARKTRARKSSRRARARRTRK